MWEQRAKALLDGFVKEEKEAKAKFDKEEREKAEEERKKAEEEMKKAEAQKKEEKSAEEVDADEDADLEDERDEL